eukprot:scaffold741_cov41-Attheya_sp.AAC.3
MGGGKALVISHLLVFLAGFGLGKYVDYGELATYRDIHESSIGKWRRRAGNAALGVFSLGTIVFWFGSRQELARAHRSSSRRMNLGAFNRSV